MTLFFKREAAEAPKDFLMKQKDYPELVSVYPKLGDAIIEAVETYVAQTFEPVEPKGLTLEEAKDKISQKHGYKDWLQLLNQLWGINQHGVVANFAFEAAELYLSSNLAKMEEENEALRKSLADTTANSIIKIDELEQQLNIAKEALEMLKHAVGLFEDLGYIAHHDVEMYCETIKKVEHSLNK